MRIILATTIEPFVNGGDTLIVDSLEKTLLQAGHQVETFKVPFHSDYKEVLDQILALRMFELGESADRLIAIRTPSYVLRHPKKILWFIHHHRGVYDFWGTKYGDIPDSPEGRRYRSAITRADNLAFGEARSIFTNSRLVSERLRKYNRIDSEVLYPPLMNPEEYSSKEYGDYFVYVSRITRHKRQHLAIEALKHTRTAVRLVIAGKPNDPAYAGELQSQADRHGLSSRLTIISNWISHEQKLDLLANSLGQIYLPFNEDSYGYAALEAQQSGKAVVTTNDSGGVLELIRPGHNGLVVSPDPRELGAALDRLYADRSLARQMGLAGRARIHELGITWDRVLTRLLS